MGESQSPFNNLIAGLIRAADLWNGLLTVLGRELEGKLAQGWGQSRRYAPKLRGTKYQHNDLFRQAGLFRQRMERKMGSYLGTLPSKGEK